MNTLCIYYTRSYKVEIRYIMYENVINLCYGWIILDSDQNNYYCFVLIFMRFFPVVNITFDRLYVNSCFYVVGITYLLTCKIVQVK